MDAEYPDNGYGPMRTDSQPTGAHPYSSSGAHHYASLDKHPVPAAPETSIVPMDTDGVTPAAPLQSPPLLSNEAGQAQLAQVTAQATAPVPSDSLDDSHFRSKVAAARRRAREREAQAIGLLLNKRGYPVRPGAITCQMYVDYNKCSFGAACVMNHPDNETGNDNDTWSDFSDEGPKLNKRGYIRRPGKAICSFYQKSGHCGFGPTCRFDHPEGIDGPMAPPIDLSGATLRDIDAEPEPSEPAKGKGKGKGKDFGKDGKDGKGKGKDKGKDKGKGGYGKGSGGGGPPPAVEYVDQYGNPVGPPPPGVQYVDQNGNPIDVGGGSSQPAVEYVDQYGNPVGPPPPGVQYVDQYGNPIQMGGAPPQGGMGMPPQGGMGMPPQGGWNGQPQGGWNGQPQYGWGK
jgi:hypothetical protein